MFHDLLTDIEQGIDVSSIAQADSNGHERASELGSGGEFCVIFHVTEYNVLERQYPESWEDHSGKHTPVCLQR